MYFVGRRCQGEPSDTIPSWYKSEVDLSDVTFSDPEMEGAEFLGVAGTSQIFHDTACALYDPADTTNPTNKTALDDLAMQIAQDFYDFREWSIDKVYNGVAAVTPTALLDTIEFRMDAMDSWTRIQSKPWNGDPIELQHYDPATDDCTDDNNDFSPISPLPCVYYYGPPEGCMGGGATATAMIDDGAISSITVTSGGVYSSTPTVAISGDGTGATATATVTGTAVTSVTVTAGGENYHRAVISFNGGGNLLQRTRFTLCLEDGRLVSRFVSYDTVTGP